MIRTFNYTNRDEIERGDIDLRIATIPGGGRGFTLTIDTAAYQFPAQAHLVVEAYTKVPEFQRWDLGPVGDVQFPVSRPLTDFGGTEDPQFRIKVVSTAAPSWLLVAERDRLLAAAEGDPVDGKRELLRLKPADLGQRVWGLNLDAEIPQLLINRRIERWQNVGGDTEFRAMVMPEVVTQILTRAVVEDPPADDSNEDDWRVLWTKFVLSVPNVDPVPDAPEDRREWVRETVDAVATFRAYLDRFCTAYEGRVAQ